MSTLDTESLELKTKKYFCQQTIYTNDQLTNAIFEGIEIPLFLKDYLIKRFNNDDGSVNLSALSNFTLKHIHHPQNTLRENLQHEIILKSYLIHFRTEWDATQNLLHFEATEIPISIAEGIVSPQLLKKFPELKETEQWGVVLLTYHEPLEKENGFFEMINFQPFNPYNANLEYYIKARHYFSINEWIDVLIAATGFSPTHFNHLKHKLDFLSCLLILTEENINMLETVYSGENKSFIPQKISKFGYNLCNHNITEAKLFYDTVKGTKGAVLRYDFVTLSVKNDDDETISSELISLLKDYLKTKQIPINNNQVQSHCGLLLKSHIGITNCAHYHSETTQNIWPQILKDADLLNHFDGLIEGYTFPSYSEPSDAKGWRLNTEYLSEILHHLRFQTHYAAIVNDLIGISEAIQEEDITAVKRLATAYLKLLFPHINSIDDISRDDFYNYCLQPAIEKRKALKDMLLKFFPNQDNKIEHDNIIHVVKTNNSLDDNE